MADICSQKLSKVPSTQRLRAILIVGPFSLITEAQNKQINIWLYICSTHELFFYLLQDFKDCTTLRLSFLGADLVLKIG